MTVYFNTENSKDIEFLLKIKYSNRAGVEANELYEEDLEYIGIATVESVRSLYARFRDKIIYNTNITFRSYIPKDIWVSLLIDSSISNESLVSFINLLYQDTVVSKNLNYVFIFIIETIKLSMHRDSLLNDPNTHAKVREFLENGIPT